MPAPARRIGWALWGLVLCVVAAAAEDPDDALPSWELLEFLGEWEDDSGQWVDPLELPSMYEATQAGEKHDVDE